MWTTINHIHGNPAYQTLFLKQESRLRWKFPLDASCYWSITANWVTTTFYQFLAYSERPTQLNSTQLPVELSRVGRCELGFTVSKLSQLVGVYSV